MTAASSLSRLTGAVVLVLVGGCAGAVVLAQTPASSPGVAKVPLEGITNFTRVDSAIGCGGATSSTALAELRRLGYVTVVSLREPSEPGADIGLSRLAAAREGITFINLPVRSQVPDGRVIEEFLKIVSNPANQPVYVYCGSGNRAAALWYVKRVRVDGWTDERALAEAEAIGLTDGPARTFVRNYVKESWR